MTPANKPMADERWAELNEERLNWEQHEEDEVAAYVEWLRSEVDRLTKAGQRTHCLVTGSPLGSQKWEREPACSCVACVAHKGAAQLNRQLRDENEKLRKREGEWVASVARCADCDKPATWQLFGSTEETFYRCDEHYVTEKHWGAVGELPYAHLLRSREGT